jgi:hypothetical protein
MIIIAAICALAAIPEVDYDKIAVTRRQVVVDNQRETQTPVNVCTFHIFFS